MYLKERKKGIWDGLQGEEKARNEDYNLKVKEKNLTYCWSSHESSDLCYLLLVYA